MIRRWIFLEKKVDKVKEVLLLLFLLMASIRGISQGTAYGLFVENLGQYPEEVSYYSEFSDGTLFIAEDGLTYVFRDQPAGGSKIAKIDHHARVAPGPQNAYALKVKFLDSNPSKSISASEERPTRYSYFYGSDPERWIRGARTFNTIRIEDLYPGIDMSLSAELGSIKYDLILDPGIDPATIRMLYDGATSMKLEAGQLHFEIPFAEFNERIPASYAVLNGSRRKVDCSYALSDNLVSFANIDIGEDEQLIIDPLLVFSTYSGSPSDNWGNTATFDDFGNAYSGGITASSRGGFFLGEFPASAGAYQTESGGGWDVALLKFDSAGTDLLYATYLGGAGSDVPQSLIVDQNGDLLILGVTSSIAFPTTENAFDRTFNGGSSFELLSGIPMANGSDLFVARLSADGSQLLSSTLLGGTGNDGMLENLNELARNYGDESRGDINFDSEGNVLIASRTESVDFPVLNAYDSSFNGGTDAVVLSLKDDFSSLNWSTYMGGTASDVALSIKIDSSDNVFVAGGTSSSDFPVTDSVFQTAFGGQVDGWIAHLKSSGDSLIASSYLGTSEYDQTFFLDLDADEDVYLAGQTTAPYPVTPGKFSSGQSGQFIHKLSNDLSRSLFSTVIGQEGRTDPNISLTAFLVNDCDNIYLSGWGSPIIIQDNNNFLLQTNGLPITSGAYQTSSDGSSFYLAVLSGDASELLYSTHLGTANSMVHVDGGTSRFDKNGIVYHSVCASCPADDSSFPTTDGAFAQTNISAGCSNAVFKFDLASLRARIQTNDLSFGKPGLDQGCIPLDVVFENKSTGGEVYEWWFGDGTSLTAFDKNPIIHQYQNPGTYQVVMRAFDPNTCIAEDYAYTTIVASTTEFKVIDDQDLCAGETLQLTASGGTSYQWFPQEAFTDANVQNPLVTPADTITYFVDIRHVNGCAHQDTITVNVVPKVQVDIKIEQSDICEGGQTLVIENRSDTFTDIAWDFGDGEFSEEYIPEHVYKENGEYLLQATIANHICVETIQQRIPVVEMFVPNVLTRNADGLNDTFKITSAFPVDLHVFNRWGQLVYQQLDYQNDWNGGDLTAGTYYYDVVLPTGEQCNGWLQIMDGK